MPKDLRSIHIFAPGDRVVYSILEKKTSKSGRTYNKHINGRAIVMYHMPEGGTYMIRTEKRGLVRIVFPGELRKL